MIRAGQVRLNGKLQRDPEAAVSEKHDRIEVNGKAVETRDKIYLMLNKPRGVVTTASDEKGRETVYTTLRGSSLPWVAPVGRLDKASEGLLLLTNDSEWGARIAAPETHLDKTYHVQVGTLVSEQDVQALALGVKGKNGEVLQVKYVRRLRVGQKNCWLEIVLDEGKNRQIRRMMESMEVEVLRLVRVAVGTVQLGDLAKGAHRSLTKAEKEMLDGEMLGSGPRGKTS
ncbi:MAG: Pseudouridine synthase, Rsu [Candidatus Sulfotelmatobacter sp.]|nr:Pseudouridine synthase, Rsu [Candidatus Sulfotelmatobacter sp.]